MRSADRSLGRLPEGVTPRPSMKPARLLRTRLPRQARETTRRCDAGKAETN